MTFKTAAVSFEMLMTRQLMIRHEGRHHLSSRARPLAQIKTIQTPLLLLQSHGFISHSFQNRTLYFWCICIIFDQLTLSTLNIKNSHNAKQEYKSYLKA